VLSITSMIRKSLGILLFIVIIPMKDRGSGTLSSAQALIKIYLSTNELQTLEDEYSWAKKILHEG
jgi:hypothetical protein